MIDVRWYGRGGQGAFTAARLLGRGVTIYGGGYAMAWPSFGPERRGAPVWSFTAIDDKKILDRGQPETCDYLLVLDETLVTEKICDVLRPDSTVILNTNTPERYGFIQQKLVCLDATRMALEELGRDITNVALLGAFVGVSGIIPLETADRVIREHFSEKLYEKNSRLLKRACLAAKGEQ